MKNILIKAYLELNLGDDLFVKILTERYKNIHFYLFTNYTYKCFNKNLTIFKYTTVQRILNKFFRDLKISQNFIENNFLKKIDGIVEIGGSIFIEDKNYKSFLERRTVQRNKVNQNYYVLGSNFGPYSSICYLDDYKNFFLKCKNVSFRDNYSFNLFNQLDNVKLAKDIVFGLEKTANQNEEYVLYSIIKPSLRKDLIDKDEEYFNQIIKSTIDLIKSGKKIKYMSFCKAEGDEESIQIILNSIPKEYLNSISTYYYSGDIDEALEVLKKAEIVIATRFHAMILGFVYGKKVLPIAYSKKTINVLKDLEFKGMCVEFDSLKDLNVENILYSGKLEEEKLKEAKQDSQKHFEKLDLYLLESDKK